MLLILRGMPVCLLPQQQPQQLISSDGEQRENCRINMVYTTSCNHSNNKYKYFILFQLKVQLCYAVSPVGGILPHVMIYYIQKFLVQQCIHYKREQCVYQHRI